jgi:hypothetical protein
LGIILKCISKKWDEGSWTELIWLKMEKTGRLLFREESAVVLLVVGKVI